jgi:ferrous iron transport protein A
LERIVNGKYLLVDEYILLSSAKVLPNAWKSQHNQHSNKRGKCMQSNKPVSLTTIPAGKPVRLVKVDGGKRLNHRMAEMGLTPGVEITILQDAGGPLLLHVRDFRIALGRGMAEKMIVVPFECRWEQ